MGDKRNYAALDWVIGEIGETLKDARQALEAHVEDPRDTARIRFCLTHIHQVHGSLQMVEFHGASLFAEEMELLAEALMHGGVSNEKEAHEVLMRSLLQLPNYLEQVKTHQDDHPGTVLPLLNDLRAVRKQSLLSETNLFNPDLSSLTGKMGSRHAILANPTKLKQVLQKLREMYQFAAASVLRGVKVDDNLNYIEKVFARLESISSGTASFPLWQISSALVEALLRDDVELSVTVRVLLRHLARELRTLEAHCPSALEAPARESLVRNLLYYVARAEDGGPRVAAVKAQYGLDHALLGGGATRSLQNRSMISLPEPDAVRAVISALQDELNTVKHLLDLALSGQGGLSDVEEMLPVVKRIADTLAVLGIGDMRKQAMDQYDTLSRLCHSGDLSDSVLIDVAGRIADLEYRLEAVGRGAGKHPDFATVDEREIEIDSAKETVLRECRVGLEGVKEAIVESLSSQWNPSHLPAAVATLHHVQGGLTMVPLPRAVAIVECCSRYINEQLSNRTASPGVELQALADVIASIDYYLERLVAGHSDDLDGYLEIAESSLEQLGYPVAKQPIPAPSMASAPEQTAERGSGETAESEASIEATPADQAHDTALSEQSVTDNAEVEPAAELEDATEEDTEEESDIDDEIIEIFVEEAAEVQATLAEYFPKWRDNFDDGEALGVVRRAFHTLKGSGRMVEALDVGELAWSIENMLNRVLEDSVSPEMAHVRVIEHALDLVPSLIEAFQKQAPNPNPKHWQQCIDWANDLAAGQIPGDLGGVEAYRDAVASQDEEDRQVESAREAAAHDLNDDDDQVLWDIFASEAKSHLKVMDQFIESMDRAAPLYGAPTDDLQRALHTLKGSAHMAAVTPIATMITPLEGFIKELRSYQLKIDEDILQLIKDAAAYTRDGLECIAQREPVTLPKQEQFLARVEELHAVHVAPLVHMTEQDAGHKQVDPRLLAIFMAEDMRLLLDADQILAQWQNDPAAGAQSVGPLITELQTLSEGAEQANLPQMSALSGQIQNIYQTVRDQAPPLDERFFRILTRAHDGLLDMVDAIAAGQNLKPVPDALQAELNNVLPTTAEADELQWEVSANDDSDMEFSADDFGITASVDEDDLQAEVSASSADEQPEQFEPGNVPSDSPSIEAPDYYDAERPWLPYPEETPADQIVTEQDTDKTVESHDHQTQDYFDPERPWLPYPEAPAAEPGFDHSAEAQDGYDLEQLDSEEISAEPLDNLLDPDQATLLEGDPADEIEASDDRDHDQLWTQVDIPEGEEEQYLAESLTDSDLLASAESSEDSDILEFDPEWRTNPEAAAEHTPEVDNGAVTQSFEPSADDEEPSADGDKEPSAEFDSELAPELDQKLSVGAPQSRAADDWPPERVPLAPLDMAEIDSEDFDPDILEIFLEEANELIEELDEAIHSWESDRDNLEAPETMKRALHTLKGGARLSGLKTLGQLVHDYESDLIGTRDINADPQFFPRIQQYQDVLLNGVRAVRAQLDGEAPPEPIAPPAPIEERESTPEEQDPAESLLSVPAPAEAGLAEAEALATTGSFVVPQKVGSSPDSSGQQPAKRQGPQEMIKVSADLLEELVNLAGETSISRGRLEQQVSDLSSAVDEVDATLGRMSEQLRRLDLETEAQVLFRREQMAVHEHFDPLEMDRYSQLQQLTRSLMESNSDLVDLKRTLSDKIKDTETLLLQQSRINSSLQEGLMRSRMVPFSRLVPRLRRIVRQVSAELGKQVNFELDNVEGEMDRSVLERMVAPLEHMLRNAVDHGVETPAERADNQKPETGRILLSLAREGGDILLRLADDGRGIDLQKVRAKAIDRGLMAPDSELSDYDVMQFILQAGFSTAESVTQISGRGVGMDVVASEIKQLGGSMVIDSESGVGTQFTVRLPFTVSVNRALMVQLSLETYAIPLNTIEGIVRVSPFELEHYYSHPDARFEYAGENYQVRHLGAILSSDLGPKLEGQMLPLPVILVRSGQHTMALQVDGLMGSREIVVKSLGPQFAAVQGISGATVMGDGSVVVIVDPHALVRREMALLADPRPMRAIADIPEVEAPEVHKTVMVVDDSVTVRKVTSRFLERQGYNVVTAKDGVDALQFLQEEIPDLMLLDIEMPRMDGFEVAKSIRSSSRLKHIPIIMITSRTGSKHREHALSIGVNDYVGKPYQEEALLKIMQGLLGTSSVIA